MFSFPFKLTVPLWVIFFMCIRICHVSNKRLDSGSLSYHSEWCFSNLFLFRLSSIRIFQTSPSLDYLPHTSFLFSPPLLFGLVSSGVSPHLVSLVVFCFFIIYWWVLCPRTASSHLLFMCCCTPLLLLLVFPLALFFHYLKHSWLPYLSIQISASVLLSQLFLRAWHVAVFQRPFHPLNSHAFISLPIHLFLAIFLLCSLEVRRLPLLGYRSLIIFYLTLSGVCVERLSEKSVVTTYNIITMSKID